MNPSDYRLLLVTAFGEWKRCHALYLGLVCQVACGAKITPATIVTIRADVERAMADLASMSQETAAQEEIEPRRRLVSGLVAMVEAAGGRAMGIA